MPGKKLNLRDAGFFVGQSGGVQECDPESFLSGQATVKPHACSCCRAHKNLLHAACNQRSETLFLYGFCLKYKLL